MVGMTTATVRIAAIPADLHRHLRVYAAQHGLTVREATHLALGLGVAELEAPEVPTDSPEARPERP